ncbi:unnamed protein product [Cylindrotheca closterium]|uniref:Uncharacterized protein n=1 Tax=Cylindrotheca closterium TaxID=2856 RepID=A0AAD2FU11_9STRA|nr:unnamed protein product [Cylindrotheca closterium]
MFLMKYLKHAYARERFLLKKSNPQGWICAQTRPAQGLHRVLQLYKNQSFPDFLIIMDDDTYYNMKLFVEHFRKVDSSKSIAIAGCRVRSPTKLINWTFAFGGYGLVVSMGWLKRMDRPIMCPRDDEYCRFIRQKNHIGEREVFKSGMTLADLSYAYALHQPFEQYRNWTTGFCLHSDWLLGYITNFYNVSRHLDAYMGSEINAERQGSRRLCDNLRGNCHGFSHVCHYSTPTEMIAINNIVRRRNPEEFRADTNGCVACEKDGLRHNNPSPTIDFFSFARNTSDFLAQKQVVGSHKSIRHFYKFSALDENDPSCFQSQIDSSEVIKGCKAKSMNSKRNWLLAGLRSPHSRDKHSSPPWLCEQKRLLRGVGEVLNQYRTRHGTIVLPDYLILADSRSYWNFDVFNEMLRNIEIEVKNSLTGAFAASTPLVVGGCTVEKKVFQFLYRVPLLSHGIVLNRGMLDSLTKPMYCNASIVEDPRCFVVEESQLWERETFRQGMSPIDLMRSDVIRRALGICIEAEWVFSFFFQFYASTKSSTLPLQASLAPADSTIRIYLRSVMKRSGPEMLCRYQNVNCNVDAPYCSDVSADQMLTYLRD